MDKRLILSLYEPPHYDAGGSYPLLVLVHGGGWQSRKVFADQAEWAGITSDSSRAGMPRNRPDTYFL